MILMTLNAEAAGIVGRTAFVPYVLQLKPKQANVTAEEDLRHVRNRLGLT